MIAGAPARRDQLDPVVRRLESQIPGLQEIVEDRIQLLLGWIPGLVQVIVNAGGVDGANRSFRVGIGRKQDALGLREQRNRRFQEVYARHTRHALVGKNQGNHVLALFQLPADIQCRLARCGAHNTVFLTVVAAQILNHSFQYADVVVDREKNRFRHGPIMPRLCGWVRDRSLKIWMRGRGGRFRNRFTRAGLALLWRTERAECTKTGQARRYDQPWPMKKLRAKKNHATQEVRTR